LAGENNDPWGQKKIRLSNLPPDSTAVTLSLRSDSRNNPMRVKVAKVMGLSNEITFTELVKALEVSRPTATRWLAMMESEGLLLRGYSSSGGRGRPKLVYRPTRNLLSFASAQNPGSLVVADFSSLMKVCRHFSAGLCSFGKTLVPCLQSSCPILSNRG